MYSSSFCSISFHFVLFFFIILFLFILFHIHLFSKYQVSCHNEKKKNQVMIITLLWGFSVILMSFYSTIGLLACSNKPIAIRWKLTSNWQIWFYVFLRPFFLHWVWWEGGWTVLGRECPRRLCSEMWPSLLVSWHILGRQSVLTILSLSFHPYWSTFQPYMDTISLSHPQQNLTAKKV